MIKYRELSNEFSYNGQFIDEEAGYCIDFHAGEECCDYIDVEFFDSDGHRICHEKLKNWTFIETPDLSQKPDDDFDVEHEIMIQNVETKELGICYISGENNGFYSVEFNCYKRGNNEH